MARLVKTPDQLQRRFLLIFSIVDRLLKKIKAALFRESRQASIQRTTSRRGGTFEQRQQSASVIDYLHQLLINELADFSGKAALAMERDHQEIGFGERRSGSNAEFRILQDVQPPHPVPDPSCGSVHG